MKKKKMIAVCISAAMMTVSMAGCGRSTSGQSSSASSSASYSTSSTASSVGTSSTSSEETEAVAGTSAGSESVGATSSSSAQPTADNYAEMRVALLLPGSANDGSFNEKGYNALMHLKDLGVDTAYSENVDASDQLSALRDYASRGYDTVIGWGSQFDDDMLTVADEFPDIQFVIGSGTVGNDTNCTSIYVDGAMLGYGYGYLAAETSKTNKVAFIGANQGNQAYTDEVCGFIEGAKAYNDDTQVTIMYVSDYSDVSEAEETTKLCEQNGCDVIFGDISEGYYGVLSEVQANGLYTFGRNASNVETYPEGVITYIDNDWSQKIEDVINYNITTGMLTGVTRVGFGTVVSGWTYNYDDTHEFNPDLITDDLRESFETNVVDKISKEGYDYSFTADDANPGVY